MNVTATIETSDEREEHRLRRVRAAVLRDRVLWWAGAAALAWVAAYAVATAVTHDDPQARQALGDLVYLVPVAGATLTSGLVARRARGRRRVLWTLLLTSNALWLAGDLVWAGYAYVLREDAPFPSVADALYLASYALVPVAVLLWFRGASVQRRARALLDSAVVTLGLGAAGWWLLVAPQLDGSFSAATATGIAYPALGVLIVVTLVSAGFGGHRNVAPSVWLVAAAFTVSALTDASYTYLSSLHDYVTGDWLNLGWQTEAVLLCLAALTALRHDEGEGQVVALGRDLAMVPVLVGVVSALGLAGVEAVRRGVDRGLVAVAAVVVATLVVRFVLSVADARRAADLLDAALREQQRLAVTDGLTGLYNRRFFEEILSIETDRAIRGTGHLALLVLDLDRFKRVNDLHGHQGGDTVLVEAAARLRGVLRPSDVVARYGGEEFVVVLPDADVETALEVAENCRRALREHPVRLADGSRVRVTASLGLATLGDHPDRPVAADDLILRADRALYSAKDAGRDRVVLATAATAEVGSDTVERTEPGALAALERLADLVDARVGASEHSAVMARWAGAVADALGLPPDRRWLVVHGARLHDVGKIALPESLLGKPGPLDEAEWRLMRSHPAAGEQLVLDILGHEELGAVVRWHHERLDGRGYPDGITGEAIPFETRIISVLDTWAAMLADRAYRPALPLEQARAELLAARGTQLDARVVDAFLTLEAAGLVGAPRKAGAEPERVSSAASA